MKRDKKSETEELIDKKVDEFYAEADNSNWSKAEAILRETLVIKPNDVWLLGQLSTMLFLQEKFKKAFYYSSKALALDWQEPLTLFIHARNLDILGFKNQAMNIWYYLVTRSPETIGLIDCDEGIEWALSLQLDSLYFLTFRELRDKNYNRVNIYVRRIKYLIRKTGESIYDESIFDKDIYDDIFKFIKKEMKKNSSSKRL
jgi:tetratricopeptide (TPR) repeat protein